MNIEVTSHILREKVRKREVDVVSRAWYYFPPMYSHRSCEGDTNVNNIQLWGKVKKLLNY